VTARIVDDCRSGAAHVSLMASVTLSVMCRS
jgi:hypothetical protein